MQSFFPLLYVFSVVITVLFFVIRQIGKVLRFWKGEIIFIYIQNMKSTQAGKIQPVEGPADKRVPVCKYASQSEL